MTITKRCDKMNYGKKLKYIMISACGMFIAIMGLGFQTEHFPGHSGPGAIGLLLVGLFLTIYGLANLRKIP